MNKVLMNFLLFLLVCFMLYFIFRSFNVIEGMKNSNKKSFPNTNGIAGNAANYDAQIKTRSTKLRDSLLISKYRKDYESIIISLDELVDNLMLKTALNLDKDKPVESLEKLVKLNESKTALNSVMKFIDSAT